MTVFHALIATVVGLLFVGGLVFVLWAHLRRPSIQAATVTKLEPYVAPATSFVHPARAFDDWIENEAKNAAAIMKAKLLADYHAAQNLAAHQAALAPKPIPLPAPAPQPAATAVPNGQPSAPSDG